MSLHTQVQLFRATFSSCGRNAAVLTIRGRLTQAASPALLLVSVVSFTMNESHDLHPTRSLPLTVTVLGGTVCVSIHPRPFRLAAVPEVYARVDAGCVDGASKGKLVQTFVLASWLSAKEPATLAGHFVANPPHTHSKILGSPTAG